MRKSIALIVALTLLANCTPQLSQSFGFLEYKDIEFKEPTTKVKKNTRNDPCNQLDGYEPDSAHTPFRFLRVNVHFLNSSDSSKNFNGAEAVKYAKNLISAANNDLAENRKMWLPEGNNTPVLPLRFRYVFAKHANDSKKLGVYCHYDDKLCYFIQVGKNRNLFDKKVINRYSVGLDSVLNLFIHPHHPDSIASSTYKVTDTGVALGNAVKIAGLYESGKPVWTFRGLVNHEFGHCLGLFHTWGSRDGCDDTPNHQNCWNKTASGPCSKNVSNNVMDYNTFKRAWTPCQLARVHRNFANLNSRQRRVLIPNWCAITKGKDITIVDSVHWKGGKDLRGNLIIAKGGTLTISCRLSMPQNAKIIIQNGGKLILNDCLVHNACGLEWQGIEIEKLGEQFKGQVIFVGKPTLKNMKHKIGTL